ncbi:MAG TPA: MerR family transcriptional regulator [Gaiellaceae bacterium]|nr:MerR family transcriptional regulator [Gaiellaceae bacterium]HET8653156.1 MerR family transcriptional regulator [Gaiellaceae bacterium]
MSATAVKQAEERPLTIGAVCRLLREEFPDISISKIRYLEDQGLLAPRRTAGRYRLFGEDDVDRLRTILRLQRDEFLPLRVIRQELATTAAKGRRRRGGLSGREDEIELAELCERSGLTPALVRQLEEYGLLESRVDAGERLFREGEADIAAACAKLARFGIDARHLRSFRSATEREVGLLAAIVTPALRSRNPERRQSGVEDLQLLAELAQELSQLLFWRALRKVAAS